MSAAESALHTKAAEHRPVLLVVDDEESVREFLTRSLQRQGFVVHSAADTDRAKALAQVARPTVDLLITDVCLRSSSGESLALWMLERGFAKNVVFISGYAREDLSFSIEERRMEFVQKPFPPSVMVEAIHRLCQEIAGS